MFADKLVYFMQTKEEVAREALTLYACDNLHNFLFLNLVTDNEINKTHCCEKIISETKL